MDQVIGMYQPKKAIAPTPKKSFRNRWNEDVALFNNVIYERSEKTRKLENKHPVFTFVYNCIVLILLGILVSTLIVYGVRDYIEKRANVLSAQAVEEYKAEQYAIQVARKVEEQKAIALANSSLEASIKKESEAMAKLFYGIRNFESKYNYSQNDLRTLARCVFNRVENPKFPNNITDVINQEFQWIGYYDTNPVLTEYYKVAEKEIRIWYSETSKPIEYDYAWAEFESDGISLKNQFESTYATKYWRY